MKTRIIQTRFWDDEFVVESSKFAKYLYIYILTSQYINISGIFQLHDKKIMMETDLTPKELEIAKEELTAQGKAMFKGGWVYVINAEKNNKYRNSPKNEVAYENELALIPEEIIAYFERAGDSSIATTTDTSIDSNHKSKIINPKSKINKIEFEKFEELTESVLSEIAERYDVPFEFVEEKKLDMEVWMGKSKKNRYSDYKKALMTWVRKDKEEHIKDFKKTGRGGVIDVRNS